MHTVMKSINRIFGSFIIVCLALVSCEKEKHPQSVDPEQPDVVVRTISVSFDTKSTRTELDGTQPKFKNKDLIKMAQVDGEAEPQVCTVKVVDNKASVETTLEGKLKAVYPHDCAVVSNNKITGVSVPASQNGTFEEAHICMAEQASEDDESLVFHNQTPILRFYVDESIQVQSITITPSSGSAITVSPSSGTHFTSSVLDGPDKRICYAAVPSGINANNFTFSSKTGTQGTVVQTLKASTSLANGTMYNIFIPYYIDLGDAGKWGYCNVGAFLPEEFGLYFAWGETTGHKANSTYTGFENNYRFDDSYTPSEDAYDLTEEYEYYSRYVLKSAYDAAKANMNDNWRMPTEEEYMNLLGLEAPTDYSDNYHTENGCGIITNANKSLIFPIAGFGDDTTLYDCYYKKPQASCGMYWSSSLWLDEFGDGYPWIFLFDAAGGELRNEIYEPYIGMPIRPIYDGGTSGGDDSDDGGLTIKPYGPIDMSTNISL